MRNAEKHTPKIQVIQGVSQAWDTALYVVFPNQRNVVFSQLGKETKSYNKKKKQNQKLTARKDMKNKL